MKKYFIRLFIISFICISNAGCVKQSNISKTAEELLEEYKSDPDSFIKYYSNKRITISGTIAFAQQNKHHPGNNYEVYFYSNTINKSNIEGEGIVCNFDSITLGTPSSVMDKKIKVNCIFDEVLEKGNRLYIHFNKGKMIE